MYLSDYRVLHSKIVAALQNEQERELVESAYDLLELTVLIQAHEDARKRFVSQVDQVFNDKLLQSLADPAQCDRASLARWAADSCFAAIQEMLSSRWEHAYSALAERGTTSAKLAQALDTLRSKVAKLGFDRLREETERCWKHINGVLAQGPTAADELADALNALRVGLQEYPFRRKIRFIQDHWRPGDDAVLAHFLWKWRL